MVYYGEELVILERKVSRVPLVLKVFRVPLVQDLKVIRVSRVLLVPIRL
jgi:hypothetical protein